MAATSEKVMIGENVQAEEDGDFIVLRVDRTHRGGLSASGKTVRVASTGGATKFGGVTLNINAYVKPS